MTTITVSLKGQNGFLQDALVSACRYYSKSVVKGDTATLTYISESSDRDAAMVEVHDSIDADRLELMGIEIAAIA
jgi:hypothetical protein